MQRIGYLSAAMAVAAVLAASSSFATEEMGAGSPDAAAPNADTQDLGTGAADPIDDPMIDDAESADSLDDPSAVHDEGVGTPSDAEAADTGDELDAGDTADELDAAEDGAAEAPDAGVFDAPGAIQHQDELEDTDAAIDADELEAEVEAEAEEAEDALTDTGGFDAPGDIQEQDDLGTGTGTAGDELEAADDVEIAPTPGAMPEDRGQLGTPGAEMDGSVEGAKPEMGTGVDAGAGGYDAPGRIQEELGSGSAAERLDDAEAAADPELQRENLQQAIDPPAAD